MNSFGRLNIVCLPPPDASSSRYKLRRRIVASVFFLDGGKINRFWYCEFASSWSSTRAILWLYLRTTST